jgi:hypothetical protein
MWLPRRLGTVLNTKVIAYKNRLLPALIVFAIVTPLLADEPSMTKIVSRIISNSVPEGSFASKPKTLYRAANKYSRTEEELDAENNIHALVIVNEPDMWMINLADKTARHIVDPGPTFNFHAAIVWIPSRNGQPEENRDFKDLEYGNEVEFFHRHNANVARRAMAGGNTSKALSIKRGAREFLLLLSPGDKPYQLDVLKNGKIEYSIRYLSYETNLPFEKSLFEPPKGLKVTEAK